MSPPRPHHAFTLIELILVLVIIGMMMAIVAPRLNGLRDRERIDGQARTLLAMFKQARTRAAQDGLPWRVVIDLEEYEAWPEASTAQGYERPMTSQAAIVELDKQVDIQWLGVTPQESGLITVTFQPSGLTEPGQILLTDDKGHAAALTCPSYSEGYRLGFAPASSDAANAGADVEE